MENILKRVHECVVSGKLKEALEIGKEAKNAGVDPANVVRTLSDAMTVVGEKYRAREIALPTLILATRCFQTIIAPYKAERGPSKGTIVMGVVQYDIHTIGKNLVIGMLQVSGFEVHDLGHDVPLQKFVDKAIETDAQVVGASTLMTATMPQLEDLMNLFAKAGLRDKVKIMVGGAPVSTKYAKRIGADGYAKDAVLAVEVANRLIRGEQAYLA